MNLVLVERSELASGTEVTLDDGRASHLLDVLRVTPGQTVRVGVIDGSLGSATVIRVADRSVTLACRFAGPPPLPDVDLLLALPRPKVMRRLWAQLAALGVRRIVLTNAGRVERSYFDTHVLTPGCYRPLLIEGLQQARDTHLPLVTVHRQFRKLVEEELDDLIGPAARIMAHPSAAVRVRDAAAAAGSRVLLAVGPEGGWNDFELGLMAARGFQRASAGMRTLRSDTACIALLALVSDAISGGDVAGGQS